MSLRKFVFVPFLLVFCTTSFSQTAKVEEKCSDQCCKDKSANATPPSVTKSAMIDTFNPKQKEIACKLTTPELQKRKEEIVSSLKKKIQQSEDLPNGYRYRFIGSDSTTDELVAFIKSEKLCCDFFDFGLAFSEDQTWLSITGPDGTKPFIKKELGL